jgi:CBS domain-containing protein
MIIVEDFMATGVQTLSETDSIVDAAATMDKYSCYHLPVINSKQKLVGLVTHRDLQRALPSPFFPPGENGIQPEDIPVSEIMRRELITVSPEAGLQQAAMFLRNQRIGCLPVIYNEKLVGIITDSDFLAVAIELLTELDHLEPMAL